MPLRCKWAHGSRYPSSTIFRCAGITTTITQVNAPLVKGDPFITSVTVPDLVDAVKAVNPLNLCSMPGLDVACLTVGQNVPYTLSGKVRRAIEFQSCWV